MRIASLMTTDLPIVAPREGLRQAAQHMKRRNVRALPVCEGDRLVGILTDWDVAKAVADEPDPAQRSVADYMRHRPGARDPRVVASGCRFAMAVTVGLLGDVMLGRAVAWKLASIPAQDVWAPELRALLARCDLVVANLECCVSERGQETRRIAGKRFFFGAPPVATVALRAIGVRAVSLANNHALDFEDDALADTLRHLDAAGIAHAGAGADAANARRPAVVHAGCVRVAVVAVTDHPREYAAGPGSWGVAWADLQDGCPDWLRDTVALARRDADLVVVFAHWGPNMATSPARWQQERARDLLDAGADLVAGHSAHVFHGVERVAQGTILYDLGDALDDYANHPSLHNELGVLALWHPEGEPELELVALRLDFARTGLAEGADADWIAARLRHACAELGTTVERIDAGRFAVAG